MSCESDETAATIDRGREFAQQIDFDGAPDLSTDSWKAQLRSAPSSLSDLFTEFTVDTTDAATGVLILRLTPAVTATLSADAGWYDLLRTTGGSPVSIFDRPLQADIREMPTVL